MRYGVAGSCFNGKKKKKKRSSEQLCTSSPAPDKQTHWALRLANISPAEELYICCSQKGWHKCQFCNSSQICHINLKKLPYNFATFTFPPCDQQISYCRFKQRPGMCCSDSVFIHSFMFFFHIHQAYLLIKWIYNRTVEKKLQNSFLGGGQAVKLIVSLNWYKVLFSGTFTHQLT